MIKEAIILAGGFGTRLQSVVKELPKPMAPINDRPFLEYLLDYLEGYGINKVILSVGYRHEVIQAHFKNKYKYMHIAYAVEEEALGTGGAIKLAAQQIEGNKFFVLNGDTMFQVNLGKLQDYHRIFGSELTMVLRKVNDVQRYGSVEVDSKGKLIHFTEKGEKTGSGSINGGVYLIDKKLIEELPFSGAFSFEKEVLQKSFDRHEFYGMSCKQYFIDIGIPEDYLRAQKDFKAFENED